MKQLYLPKSVMDELAAEEKRIFACLICGADDFPDHSSMEAHVINCARFHEGEIERYRRTKRPEEFFGDLDPEYRAWQRKTGKLY